MIFKEAKSLTVLKILGILKSYPSTLHFFIVFVCILCCAHLSQFNASVCFLLATAR